MKGQDMKEILSGGPKDRNATLSMKLKADSGYESTETHRVSPDQWSRICAIANETPAARSGGET